jgi:hypothetical protein
MKKNCKVKIFKNFVDNKNKCNKLDEEVNDLSLGFINSISSKKSAFKIILSLNFKNIEMEVDSGACSSVIRYDFYKKYFNEIQIVSTEKNLNVITGNPVKVIGKIIVKVKDLNCEETFHELELFVIETPANFMPLLGRDWLDVLFPN